MSKVIYIKKIAKIAVIIIVLIVMVVAAAITMFEKIVNPDTFKERLSSAVYLRTGRQCEINGNMGVSFFPWIGVWVENVALSNAPRFKETNFAVASEVRVQVKTLPLLFGKVEMGKLVFKDLYINLTKKPSGITNWNDLVNKEAETEQGTSGKPAQLSALYISSVDVGNATIVFDDQQKNKRIMLKNLHLEGQKINLQGIPFLMKAEGVIENTAPNFVAAFNFNGNFNLDLQKKIYSTEGLNLQGELISSVLRDKVPFTATANIVSDFGKQSMSIDNFTFSLANVKATGALQVMDIIYAPNVEGSLDVSEFDPRPILHAIGVIKDAGAISADVNSTNNAASSANPSTWQKAALKFSIQTTSKFVKIPQLEIKFNDTVLTGSGSYSHFNDKIVAFDLTLNQIDLDRYLPKTGSQVQASIPQQKQNIVVSKSSLEEPLSNPLFNGLRQVLLNGDIHIGVLKFNNMRFSKVEMEVEGEKGNVNLKPISFDFYQGKASGDINLDVRTSIPRIAANGSFNSVDVKPLFKDVFNTDKLGGTGFINVKLNTEGTTKDSLLRNLNGTGGMRIDGGDFYGVDVGYQVERGRALFEGRGGEVSQISESSPPHTTFDELTSSFKITTGILSTNNLTLLSKAFRVNGSGMVNLASQTMDVLLQATYLVNGNFYVPIRITGAFASPNITVDMAVLLQKIIEDKAGKAIKDIKIKGIKIDDKTIRKLLHL